MSELTFEALLESVASVCKPLVNFSDAKDDIENTIVKTKVPKSTIPFFQ